MDLIRLAVHLLVVFREVYFLQAQRVTQTLEPPAQDTGGTRTFSYCPTGSVSVNVTCKTEGLETALGIPPQVIIGPDHFYLANKGEVDQWRINVFWSNHTLLFYSLPLTDATRGLSISCRSENVVSQSITLQADTSQCVHPTAVIPPSTSSVSAGGGQSSTQPSSMVGTATDTVLLPTGSSADNPGFSSVLQGSIASASVTFICLVVLVVAIVLFNCRSKLKKKVKSHDVTTLKDLKRSKQVEQATDT